MLTDFIIKLMGVFLDFYTNNIHPMITNMITQINTFQSYTSTFTTYLGGVYFILGKSLCIFIVTTFGIILVIRLFFALVNIIGQYVP